MKKIIPNIAGALLGLLFLMSSLMYFFNMVPEPKFPTDSPIARFMSLFASTGYFGVIKSFELIGGILVAFPRTRNFGLLVLGPIIVNILTFTVVIAHGGLFNPLLDVVVVLALYLLFHARKQFAGLLN